MYLLIMTFKTCNNKVDCTSKGELLPEDAFSLIKSGGARKGLCRVCIATRAKAKRAEKAREREKARPAKRRTAAKDETALFNSINTRW